MERKKTQNKPPDSWFQTYITPGSDMISIGMSEEFRNLGNGEVGKRMNQWVNYARILSTETAFSPQEKEIAEQVIKEAEIEITRSTGFSPQTIWDLMVMRSQQNPLAPHPSSNGTK